MPEPTPASIAAPATWRGELRALLALSGPLALANLAQIAMGTTDVMMMGSLGANTLAAGALGSNLYFMVLIFGIGLLNAATPMMARELGRGAADSGTLGTIVRQGFWSALCLALPCWAVLWWSERLLLAMGQNAALAAAAGSYVHALQWSLLPGWCFLVLRSFVSALERPVWALVIVLIAVGVNALANWCLLLGHCGCQSMGIAGSGLATLLSSALMFAALGVVVGIAEPFRRFRVFAGFWRIDGNVLRALWRLGLPMAATLSFEVTLFNAAVFLMGLIGAASLAAHSIAIQLSGLSFMVPLGIGQAVTVRVGRAYGAQDYAAITRAGWTAFWLGAGFMAAMSAVMILAPRLLISAFLQIDDPRNAEVIGLARIFLLFAALYQIADGTQAVGSGMLRGLHDARAPMMFALVGYWGIGLPLGVVLAFPLGLHGAGIWTGLATALAIVACLMIRRWSRREALGLLQPRP
jgi:MATE family multidrug resistance protein